MKELKGKKLQSMLGNILLIFPRFLDITLNGTFLYEIIDHIIYWLFQCVISKLDLIHPTAYIPKGYLII